jgi:fructokinase
LPEEPRAFVQAVSIRHGLTAVVTLGREGVVAATADAAYFLPALAIDVVDTVGAGDSFGAALIAALMDEGVFGSETTRLPDKTRLARAVSYAVAASAITCTRTGATPPSRPEIEAQLRSLSDAETPAI